MSSFSVSPPTYEQASSPSESIVPNIMVRIPSHYPHLHHHLRPETQSYNVSKPKATLVLSSRGVFVQPGGRTWSHALEDLSLPGGSEDNKPGTQGRVHGVLHVISPVRRKVKGIRVKVEARHRIWISSEGLWEDESVWKREVWVEEDEEAKRKFGPGTEVQLEQGINTYEFSMIIPPDVPTYEKSPFGKVKWTVTGTVLGTGGLLSADLQDDCSIYVVSNPVREEGALQLTIANEGLSPTFGLYSLRMTSNEFIVASPLGLSFTLFGVPSIMTIFAIRCYLFQHVVIKSTRRQGRVEHARSPRKLICLDGPADGYSNKGFAQKARKDKTTLLEGKSLQGGEWRWRKVGKLLDEDSIRPTTLPGTKTSLAFSSELVFEVIFNETTPGGPEGEVKCATLYKHNVNIASCGCMIQHVTLPNYAESDSVELHPGVRGGTVICMCDQRWDRLEAQEKEIMHQNEHTSFTDPDALTGLDLPSNTRESNQREEVSGSRNRERKVGEIY
ncbi:hypothetical protein [Phaffia rhodozyma]|uniref:Immunoglobulin E-set n=1 Tax=Phaffia rhodozyma TaxID=264483 RepID=A0A0F7SWL5_PHARH|nr:hypothetical protein [Phaffia rhodozyma]